MKITNPYLFSALIGLLSGVAFLTGCISSSAPSSISSPAPATVPTADASIESALPLIRVGASVATGAVLDFAVKQASTRTRMASELHGASSVINSLANGTFPTVAQFQAAIVSAGGSQSDAGYAQFSTAITGLYAVYYPKLAASTNPKTIIDLFGAISGGIDDATAIYVTAVPAVAAN